MSKQFLSIFYDVKPCVPPLLNHQKIQATAPEGGLKAAPDYPLHNLLAIFWYTANEISSSSNMLIKSHEAIRVV